MTRDLFWGRQSQRLRVDQHAIFNRRSWFSSNEAKELKKKSWLLGHHDIDQSTANRYLIGTNANVIGDIWQFQTTDLPGEKWFFSACAHHPVCSTHKCRTSSRAKLREPRLELNDKVCEIAETSANFKIWPVKSFWFPRVKEWKWRKRDGQTVNNMQKLTVPIFIFLYFIFYKFYVMLPRYRTVRCCYMQLNTPLLASLLLASWPQHSQMLHTRGGAGSLASLTGLNVMSSLNFTCCW